MTDGIESQYESNMELSGSEPSPSPEEPEATTPAEESPAPEAEKEIVDAPDANLYDLPDGRKVDAATLTKEWKDNFLPEYTRKSQRLSEFERGPKDVKNTDEDVPAWKKADYVPESYADVIEIAKAEAIRELQSAAHAEETRIQEVKDQVEAQVLEIKKADPKLDENALFAHANKYGFQDLKAAHENMVDMRKAVISTEARTVKNLKSREAEAVSGGTSGATSPEDGYDPREMSTFGSAMEYLEHLNSKK